MMSNELYDQLNRAFDAVRQAEKDAARLEREAENIRLKAFQVVRDLYVALNEAIPTK